MFWNKKPAQDEAGKSKAEKLPGPKQLPDPVRKYLVDHEKKDPTLLTSFKAVMRPSGDSALSVRLFDADEATVKGITVADYTSLDEHPGLIFYEGSFDKKSGKVELAEKRELKPRPEVPVLSEAEIRQKIEGLTQPGSSAFFYLGGSPAYGGPFSRGAAIIELNPNYPGEKQRKYIVYVASVDGLEPVSKRDRMFDSDKAKEVTKWVAERHHKPSAY